MKMGGHTLRLDPARVMKNEDQLAGRLSEIWGISAGWFSHNIWSQKLDKPYWDRYKRFLRTFPSADRMWTHRMPRDSEGLFLPRRPDEVANLEGEPKGSGRSD